MFKLVCVFFLISAVFTLEINRNHLKELLVEAIIEDELEKELRSDLREENFCATRLDGDYTDPKKCDGYITCSNHVAYRRDCPGGLAFSERDGQCKGPVCTGFATPTFCGNRGDGNYKFPPDCTKFFTCANGQAFLKSCPKAQDGTSLEWDSHLKMCNYANAANCRPVQSTPKFCIMLGRLYIVGEKWTVGCTLSCTCGPDGREDCRQICPQLTRPCGFKGVKSTKEVPSPLKPSCKCTVVKECNE